MEEALRPVTVDLDSGVVAVPGGAASLPPVPQRAAAQFVRQCRRANVPYEYVALRRAEIDAESDAVQRAAHEEAAERGLAAACLELMASVFGHVRSDIVFDLQPPVFKVGPRAFAPLPAAAAALWRTGRLRVCQAQRAASLPCCRRPLTAAYTPAVSLPSRPGAPLVPPGASRRWTGF